jgi:predicted ATPase/class 3 adenylate cyclase
MDREHEQSRTVVTLLVTGVEGSGHLSRTLRERYAAVIARHHEIVRAALDRHRGSPLRRGRDSHLAAFEHAVDAAAAAVAIQQALAREPWPLGVVVRVRIGLHSGRPVLRDGRHHGIDVRRAARISAAAHGGQVLLSITAREALADARLPPDTVVRDLGAHRLHDLHYPETLFELAIPGVRDGFPPVRSLGNGPHHLLDDRTTFVRRAGQVLDLGALLLRDGARLVTLTGASGIGKKRLSWQVAAGLLDAFPDGVFQVPLASLTEPALVGATIAHALAIPEIPGRSAIDSLAHQLASKRSLLVLNDVEPRADAASLVGQLLTRCAQLSVLVTSHAPLGLRFEREYPVPPMKLAGDESRAQSELPACEAVQLFVERARDFDSRFEITRDNAVPLAEICARLAGLPLAIELAASRAKTLGPQAIASALIARRDTAPAAAQDAPARTRLVRAAIAWTYELLDAEQQSLFRRAATFAGGFDADSIEQVLTLGGQRTGDLIGRLEALVGYGLVLREEDALGESRLRMLEPIREYGLEQLVASGEDVALRGAHADHFLALAERCAPELMGARQRSHVQQLLTETDNLRAALSFAIDRDRVAIAARMIQALLWLWIPQGLFTEGRVWTERALRRPETGRRSREHALMLDAAGWLAIFSGDYRGALGHCEKALALFEEAGTPADVARTKMALGITTGVLGRIEESARLLGTALTVYRDLNDTHGTARALIALADAARARGDEPAAIECCREALSLLRAIGNVHWAGHVLQSLAQFRLHQGDWKGASGLLAEALELGREYNHAMVVNLYVAAMGGVAVVRGRATDGARLFGAVSAALQLLGAAFEPTDQQELERHMAAARSALGDEAFEQAFAEGSHWPLDRAIGATLPLRG